jgi:hypothetical protein
MAPACVAYAIGLPGSALPKREPDTNMAVGLAGIGLRPRDAARLSRISKVAIERPEPRTARQGRADDLLPSREGALPDLIASQRPE